MSYLSHLSTLNLHKVAQIPPVSPPEKCKSELVKSARAKSLRVR